MIIVTVYLVKLMGEVFGREFVDEKKKLKYSLMVFVSTYLIRAILFWSIRKFKNAQQFMWQTYPLTTELIYVITQLIYDILPQLLILHQHHTSFSEEDEQFTSQLMSTENTSLISREQS